jgi:glycine/D-amino acid oxidase-like deaminating enzyme
MTQADIIIVGGGFAGIYSAWRLARDGMRVTLVEASDHLGGTLWSRDWNGYLVDPGTHNFDLRSPIGAEFYSDILRDDLKETDRHDFASTTARTVSHGFEMPDFSVDDPDLCRAALEELSRLKGSAERDPPESLVEWFAATYGKTLGERLVAALEKVIAAPASDIAVEARGALGMLTRPKIGTDREMIALKESDPFYDARLGVTLESGDPRFAGRSVHKRFGYPSKGALRGFCISAEARLRELGVDVLTGTKVTAIAATTSGVAVETTGAPLSGRRLFWTLPDNGLLDLLGISIDLKAVVQPVGSAFFAFEVPSAAIADIDYLHDFSPSRRPYRYNRAGVYSGQIKEDGRTFVTAEVPSHPAQLGAVLCDAVADTVWQDMREAGFVQPGTELTARMHWGYPVAFTLPRMGWRGPMEAATAAIASASPRLSTIRFGHRGRHAFMTLYEDTLQHELRT